MNLQSEQWTAEDWARWVTTQVQKRESVYCTDPDELISAYNREINYTRDYHGRELLELLQNADDSGVDFGHRNKVAIVLMREGLCIANTGNPFSESGIKSLMVSDNSPKKKDRARYIGNKGLGFRSILSWTSCPFILSGNLALGFDRCRAQMWLDTIGNRNEILRQKIVAQIENQGEQQLVPTLAIPAILDASGGTEGLVPDADGFSAVWTQAKQLREDGYDTVIALPFTEFNAYQEAQEQLDEIGREILLFTKHLASLTVQWSDRKRHWWVDRADDIVEIKSDDEQTQIWQVFELLGDIPDHLLRDDLKKTPGYEINIAVPADQVETPPFLFNYFQTQVRFPYPVIAHATFEMVNNRQNIPLTDANRYLVGKLAELMAQVAEASHDTRDPWRPLSFISANNTLDPILERMGFRQALTAAAKDRAVVPIRVGHMVKPCDAKRLKTRAGAWLPRAYFGDVVELTDNDTLYSMLDELDVPILSEQTLSSRLEQVSQTLELAERAALIVGLTRSRLMPQKPTPPLLTDHSGEIIPATFQVFLPPEKTSGLTLPDWMSLRMLNSGLNSALRQQFGSGVRNLTNNLDLYRLSEYSLQALTQAVVAQANERIKSEPEQERLFRDEAFKAIFDLYQASIGEGDSPRPPNASVQVLTAAGSYAPASSLYFSDDYPCGKLTQALYGALSSKLLVAAPTALQIEYEADVVECCLRWLGVADRPRIIQKTSHGDKNSQEYLPQDYQEFVKSRLTYPAETFHAEAFEHPSKLEWAIFSKVESVDRLEELIQFAAPPALLAWVALDERVENWRRQGDTAASVGLTPPSKIQFRRIRQPIPSYVSWILEQKPWLPTSNGNNQPPGRCITAASLAEELKAILPRPALVPTLPIFQELGVDQLSFRNALQRVGVRQSLEELSQDEIYQLLLDLPHLDSTGQCAKSLHRALMLRPDESTATESHIKAKFLRCGKLWGVKDNSFGYYPVSELHYVGTNVVPQVVARLIPRLELDKKQGPQKVQRVFGVQTLDSSKWEVKVTSMTICGNNEAFAREGELLKPYVYAFRLFSDPNADGQRKLRNLKLHLCRHVEGIATVGGAKHPFALKDKGEMIVDDDAVYLYTDFSYDQPFNDVVLMDAVGEVLSEVLGVERGSDFARLASAPESQRIALLARVLGATPDDAKHLLGQAQEKLNMKIEEILRPDHNPVYVPPPVVRPPDTVVSPSQEENTITDQKSENPQVVLTKGPLNAVSVQNQQHTPTAAGRKVELRVQATPLGTRLPHTDARVTDAARCEEFAVRFEEAQSRYPLLVSQLKGLRGYGCDVLSFVSSERREQFISQPDNPNTELVERFIEVKGKNSENSTIELRGNELLKAQQFGPRFYLYRVYEETKGEFLVLILDNPLSAKCSHIYEVNLSQQERTTKFIASEERGKPQT